MRSAEEITATANAWREQEREENREIIEEQVHDDRTLLGMLIRCGHQYTRGLADALEWVLGGEHGALDRTAADVAEESEEAPRLRDAVRGFALLMEVKLARHDRRRGESWREEPVEYLLERLQEETAELIGAIETGKTGLFVSAEAADVGNFAMMIHEVYGNSAAAEGDEAAEGPLGDGDGEGEGEGTTVTVEDGTFGVVRFWHGLPQVIALGQAGERDELVETLRAAMGAAAREEGSA